MLLSSHDLNLIAPHCDAVALLHAGRMQRPGPPATVLDPATIETVFGVASAPPSGYFPRDFRRRP